jgi:hypothetical protein
LMGEKKAAEDKAIEDYIKTIEKLVKSGKITVEKGLQMINLIAGKNYAFLQNEQDLINGYLRDRLDDTLPKIGNNKSSWQMFRDGIQPTTQAKVEDVSFDDQGKAEVTYSTKQEAIDDVRADMDFRTARINEAARSGALSIEDAATQRRAAIASYVSGLANIESQYAVKESKVEETKPEPKKEEKSIEMDSLEATDPDVQFNLFEDSWDATVDGKTIASGVSKEEAVSKTTKHKEASKKLEDGYVSVTHSTGGKNRTYTVYLYEGGTIRNSNGKPIYESNGKIRTAILAKAEENRSKLEKSLEPILPLELSDQEWADFTESGSVAEDRLRSLVAKEESGATMDLKEQTILDGKLGRIEEGKGNVSKSSDTEISNTKKKEVSSPGNTQSKTKGTGINMSAGSKTGATRMSKKEKKAAATAAKVTKEQINGAVIPGKEDTEGC